MVDIKIERTDYDAEATENRLKAFNAFAEKLATKNTNDNAVVEENENEGIN